MAALPQENAESRKWQGSARESGAYVSLPAENALISPVATPREGVRGERRSRAASSEVKIDVDSWARRRWPLAPVRRDPGSNPTATILIPLEFRQRVLPYVLDRSVDFSNDPSDFPPPDPADFPCPARIEGVVHRFAVHH